MPKLGAATVIIKANLKGLKKDLQKAKKLVKVSMSSISVIASGVGKAFQALGKVLKGAFSLAFKAIKTVMKSIISVVKKTFTYILKIVKRAALGIAAAIGYSLFAFGRFDKAMRRATAVSEVTARQFELMSKMAREQAIRLNMPAHELAEGFYFLGSAGLSATEQIQAFVPVATLAKAATIGMGEAAEMIVDTMKGFKIGFEKTAHVTDVLAKAVTSSNMTFSQLGESLSYVSGIARMTNNNLEDTTAAIAQMADVGLKGSRAGVYMRAGLIRLMAPMSTSRKVMKSYGIAVYDANNVMKPFVQLVGEISQALKGAGEKEKNFAFKALFGQRAIAGQIAIFNTGRQALRKFANMLKTAGGYAEKVAKKQLNTLTEQFGRLRKSVNDTFIVLGRTLGPALKPVIADLLTFSLRVTAFLEEHKWDIAEWAELFVNKIYMVKDAMKNFISYMKTDWKKELGEVLKWAKDLFDSFGNVIATTLANSIQKALNKFVDKYVDWYLTSSNDELKRILDSLGISQIIPTLKHSALSGKSESQLAKEKAWLEFMQVLKDIPKNLKKSVEDALADNRKRDEETRKKYEALRNKGMGLSKWWMFAGMIMRASGKAISDYLKRTSGDDVGGGGGGGGTGKIGFVGAKEAWKSLSQQLTSGGREPATEGGQAEIAKAVNDGSKKTVAAVMKINSIYPVVT